MSKKEVTKDSINFTNIIVLRTIYDKVSDMKYFIQPIRDKRTGQYPKCIKRVTSEGNMIMSDKEKDEYAEGKVAFFPETHVFTVQNGKSYNLDDIWQAAEWEAIKNCPLIAPDRNAKDAQGNLIIDGPISRPNKPTRNGIAELYIDHPGLDTQRKVSRKQLVHKAESFIFEDQRGADGQRSMARILGKDMSNQPIADVIDFLTRIAEKDPNKIINLYTGGDIALRLLLIDAKEKRVIYIKNKLYLYGDNIVLGATDDAALAWMKDPKNMQVLELIKKDTYPDYYASK